MLWLRLRNAQLRPECQTTWHRHWLRRCLCHIPRITRGAALLLSRRTSARKVERGGQSLGLFKLEKLALRGPACLSLAAPKVSTRIRAFPDFPPLHGRARVLRALRRRGGPSYDCWGIAEFSSKVVEAGRRCGQLFCPGQLLHYKRGNKNPGSFTAQAPIVLAPTQLIIIGIHTWKHDPGVVNIHTPSIKAIII